MTTKVSRVPLYGTNTRLVVATSLLFSLCGCAMGPTRKPIVPVSSTAPLAGRPAPQDLPARDANRASPRVTLSPLQGSSQGSPSYTPNDPGRDRAEAARTLSANEVDRLASTQPNPRGSLPTGESARNPIKGPPSSVPVGNRVAEGASASTTPRTVKPDTDSTIVRKIESPQHERVSSDLPKPDAAPATDGQGNNQVYVSANQCWGQAAIVPTSKKKVTQMVTEEARTRYRLSQAKLRNDRMPVVVKEAAQTYKLEQPQYMQVTESVKVQEAYKRLRVEPAEYKTEERDVLIESARIGLRPCPAVGARSSRSTATSQATAQCSYEIPARYQRIKVQTLVKPETVREELVPAVYKEITKMVLSEPAKVVPVQIPESTVDMSVSKVEVPPAAVPEQVQAVTVSVDVTEYENKSPQLTWSRVICESDLSPDLIKTLQTSLQREGWMRGKADGKVGAQTLQAVKEFQASKGVESDYVTYQVLEWLGIQTGQTRKANP
jgi:Putative peptidoglycan binding domain